MRIKAPTKGKLGVALAASLALGVAWAQEEAATEPKKLSTTVTLTVSDAALRDVTDKIREQTGLRVRFIPAGGRSDDDLVQRINVDFKDTPLWQAIMKIAETLDQPKGTLDAQIGTPTLVEGMDGMNGVPVVVSGGFLIAANRVEHNIEFGHAPDDQDQVFVSLRVIPEPATLVVHQDNAIVPSEAVDEKGVSLVPAKAGQITRGTIGLVRTRNDAGEVHVFVTRPPNGGRKIARLKGELHALVATKVETIKFDNLTDGKSNLDIAGVKVTASCTAASNGQSYSLSVAFDRGSLNDEAWKKADLLAAASRLRMETADGKLLRTNGTSASYGPKSRSMSQRYTTNAAAGSFGAGGGVAEGAGPGDPPAVAYIEVVREAREVTVPFEFADLPLP